MNTKRLRILYVPNEHGEHRQDGIRRAFNSLVRGGLISEIRIFSLLWRVREGQGEDARRELIDLVAEFRPDLILMQHLGGTGLTAKHFAAMRSVASFELIYHEADPYSRFLHPLPSEARVAGREAEVVFTVGSGVFASNFVRAGAKDVRWASSVFDPYRFGFDRSEDPLKETEKQYQVVMIANRSQPRLPFRALPGAKTRNKLVSLLSDEFGDAFAIYGRGWDTASARGPIPYNEQGNVVRSSWVSVNWDHYPRESMYFSDRLPTSLAVGTIHVTSGHPGYDQIFGEAHSFIRFGNSPQEIIHQVRRILSDTAIDERIELARRSQALAQERFRQDDQLVAFLNYGEVRVSPQEAKELWSPTTPMLAEM